MKEFRQSLLFALNYEYIRLTEAIDLHDDDEIAVFPPVSGGSSEPTVDFFELTNEPIDVGAAARRILRPECGATVTLDGYVRALTGNRKTLYIVYEAAQLGLPRAKISRMLVNVAVEAGLGIVPLLGDLLDVVWKANLRNVAIIDEHFGMMPNWR